MTQTDALAPEMSKAEYQSNLQQIYLFAKVILSSPAVSSASDMLRMIDRVDTIAPFIDPTAWINGQQKVGEDKAMIRAVANFHAEISKVLTDAGIDPDAWAIGEAQPPPPTESREAVKCTSTLS